MVPDQGIIPEGGLPVSIGGLSCSVVVLTRHSQLVTLPEKCKGTVNEILDVGMYSGENCALT